MPKNAANHKDTKQTLALGVFFLTVSNVLTKLCGMFLKVPLTNALGDTGMAYFNLAYAVYKWFYMISTAGLPVAAAVLTARFAGEGDIRCENLRRVRNVTLGAFCAVGIFGSLCMFFGAPLFASLQQVENAVASISAIAPALFCICIASALRGWYQGLGSLLPASIAQVAEACTKMVCGLCFGTYAISRGYPIYTVAAYAIFGLTAGCLLGMLVMLIALPVVHKKHRIPLTSKQDRASGTDAVSCSHLLHQLLRIAIPVTLSASVLSLCDMLDSMIVIRRLCGAGMAEDEALRLYGNYTALAVPMFNLPPILIYPVTTALIPVITAAFENKKEPDKRSRLVTTSISATAYIALPCAAGMSVMAEPLLRLLYRDDLAATGAPMLKILSIATFFLSMLAMTNAILQAADHARYPVYSICAGAVVKLISSWVLCGRPELGILGTPLSTVLCYTTMALCNLYFVVRATGISLPLFRALWKPALCSVLCAFTASAAFGLLYGRISEAIATLGAVVIGGITYLAAMIAVRGFSRDLVAFFKK